MEVADVVRSHGERYLLARGAGAPEMAVLRHLADCRTAALGGHLDACEGCGKTRVSYNSCRDRHCPKCGSVARADWLDARLERMLPVAHFHVVFTIPEQLNALALGNRRALFDMLFDAAAATLKTIAADPQHLGAQLGFTAVLHTWGQNLLFHPHLHCVVTAGGLGPDGRRWIDSREDHLLPVRVLSRMFRGKFLAALESARGSGSLRLGASTAPLADSRSWNAFRDDLYRRAWVVYAKPPLAGPRRVFEYLARYTHRVAITNSRIARIDGDRVSFTYKDYADGGRRKIMTLDAIEFLRRFLLHVLPRGFTRIRHYGLCAGRNVDGRLQRARRLLEARGHRPAPIPLAAPGAPWWQRLLARTGIDFMRCPHCGARMTRLGCPPVVALLQPLPRNCRAPP